MKKFTVKFIKVIDLIEKDGSVIPVNCFEVSFGKRSFPMIESNGDEEFRNNMQNSGGAMASEGMSQGLMEVACSSNNTQVADSHMELANFISNRLCIILYSWFIEQLNLNEKELEAVIAHEFRHCCDFTDGKRDVGLKAEVRADTFAAIVVNRKSMLGAIKKAGAFMVSVGIQPDNSIHRHRERVLEVGFIRFIAEKLIKVAEIKAQRWFNRKLMSVTDIKLVCF